MVRFRRALIKLIAGRMPVVMNVAFHGRIVIEKPNGLVCGNEFRGPA